MKKIKNMSQVELAAYIQDAMQAQGIPVVLSFQVGARFRFTATTNMFQKIWI